LIRKTDFWKPIFDQEDQFLRLIFDAEHLFLKPIFDKEDWFFDKEDPVSINHWETTQIAASGFLKHSEETGPIPDCSFYLVVSMSRDCMWSQGLGQNPEDFGRIFISSLGTRIFCKLCPTGSAQRGAGNYYHYDAESGLASYCGGLHIHLPRNLLLRSTHYARSVISRSGAALAATIGHYLIKIWNPREIFFLKIIRQKSSIPNGEHTKGVSLYETILIAGLTNLVITKEATCARTAPLSWKIPHLTNEISTKNCKSKSVYLETALEAPTIVPQGGPRWAQYMRQQRQSVSVYCWFQDGDLWQNSSLFPQRPHSPALNLQLFLDLPVFFSKISPQKCDLLETCGNVANLQ